MPGGAWATLLEIGCEGSARLLVHGAGGRPTAGGAVCFWWMLDELPFSFLSRLEEVSVTPESTLKIFVEETNDLAFLPSRERAEHVWCYP